MEFFIIFQSYLPNNSEWEPVLISLILFSDSCCQINNQSGSIWHSKYFLKISFSLWSFKMVFTVPVCSKSRMASFNRVTFLFWDLILRISFLNRDVLLSLFKYPNPQIIFQQIQIQQQN